MASYDSSKCSELIKKESLFILTSSVDHLLTQEASWHFSFLSVLPVQKEK